VFCNKQSTKIKTISEIVEGDDPTGKTKNCCNEIALSFKTDLPFERRISLIVIEIDIHGCNASIPKKE